MPWLALFLIFTAPLTYSQQTGSESIPLEPLPGFSGSNALGSTYVSLDSWIYPAFDRLHALGYADAAYLGMRPWTRLACLHILQETSEKLDSFRKMPRHGAFSTRSRRNSSMKPSSMKIQSPPRTQS
jgi:hypothetical protein